MFSEHWFQQCNFKFFGLFPQALSKWLIMCKQTFTCTRDLMIKKSSGVKPFAKNPLCKERTTPTYLVS